MNKRKIGSRYEESAAAFLQKQGFRILGKNFRCRQGEIDLVCREGKELVFTEVKYRSDASCGSPFEAVDFRKQEKIRRTALFYLCRYGYPENTPCRFDVVGITGSNIQLIRNAFYIDLYRKEADR